MPRPKIKIIVTGGAKVVSKNPNVVIEQQATPPKGGK